MAGYKKIRVLAAEKDKSIAKAVNKPVQSKESIDTSTTTRTKASAEDSAEDRGESITHISKRPLTGPYRVRDRGIRVHLRYTQSDKIRLYQDLYKAMRREHITFYDSVYHLLALGLPLAIAELELPGIAEQHTQGDDARTEQPEAPRGVVEAEREGRDRYYISTPIGAVQKRLANPWVNRELDNSVNMDGMLGICGSAESDDGGAVCVQEPEYSI